MRLWSVSGVVLTVSAASALLQCKHAEQNGASGGNLATSAIAAALPSPLDGTYRVDAMVALNDQASKQLGATRVSMEDMMRKSMTGGTYIFMRMALKFSGQKLVVRTDSVFRFEDGYQWGWCEGTGTALWSGNQLNLPEGVATEGSSGFISAKTKHNGACNANIAAGTFKVEKEGGETRLRGTHDGSEYALVLVRDDTDPAVKERAAALAGNTDSK